jgi:predicted acyl esterase
MTILIMTPYDKRLLGAAIPVASAKSNLLDREHYAFVVVDWRGFFGSKDAKPETRKPAI